MSNEKKELFEVIGKFFVENSRKALEELSKTPITLEFFNSIRVKFIYMFILKSLFFSTLN